jgi:hypothetical protein
MYLYVYIQYVYMYMCINGDTYIYIYIPPDNWLEVLNVIAVRHKVSIIVGD